MEEKSTKTQTPKKEPVLISKILKDDGTFPNNEKLPLVVYQQAFGPDVTASEIESVIHSNGWGNNWRNGVYSYHHYHSNAHEFLGVYSGSATVQFGGENGPKFDVKRGDAVVVPAGVAHKKISSSSDFALVGAYPPGQSPDMNYGKPGERPTVDESIRNTSLPTRDPAFGTEGPLMKEWK